MDEMENKEELEQTVPETIEETSVEESTEEAAETAEVHAEQADEAAAEEESAVEESAEETVEAEEPAAEETPVAEKATEKSGIIGIVIGLAAFIAILAFCWMSPAGGSVKDTGVMYAKDNALYLYDLKNEPYLLQENIADGGSYHYFYTAWGASVAEEGDWAYYIANIDETGAADLYRKNMKDAAAEGELIDSNVYDYMASKDGEVVAYLAMDDDSLELRIYNGKESTVIADGMHLEDGVYSLSADGKYLVYTDAYDMLCATETNGAATAAVLTDDSPLYVLAEEAGILYFVSKAEDSYNIYSYDFNSEPALVAENASYMELMPNGKDLLYGVMPAEIIPYSELLIDDMAEADAAMTEDDENYEQKLMRDEIRVAMESGEGIQPMLQEYYVLANGKATLVADNVISAIAVDSERPFVTGYKALEFQPIQLSMVSGGLEMVEMIYYMTLNYGGMEVFLADGNGNLETMTGTEVQLDTIKISKNGQKAAYLATDAATGGNVLMQMTIGKAAEATAVQTNVEDYAFLGGNGPLCYYYDYANGAGTVGSVESDRTITGALGVQFAEDVEEVYYIADANSITGLGQMQHWDGSGEPVIVDGGVFAFQYKGNGKAAVLYNYDVAAGTGDLGYYNGKGVTMLDEDVTALFMY